MPGLDLPDPCPGTWILGLPGRLSMHSRPPRSLPEANPPPDLREGPRRHTRRPTSARPQSWIFPARPPRKTGGRENSCRANPGPTWASCSLEVLSPNGLSPESRISLLGNIISLCGKWISLLENRISLLDAYAKILKVPSRMVFGHNLHYMAPFAIPRAGFCMVLQRASFVVFMPLGGFGSPGSDFGFPGRHFGLGTFLAQCLGPGKHTFARK